MGVEDVECISGGFGDLCMVSYIGQGMLHTDGHCYSSIRGHKVVLFQPEYPPEAHVKNSDF